jgi:hypothetical protein
MIYAILTPKTDEPLGYYSATAAPTPEDLADHMAKASGFADREEWMASAGIDVIGYALVH